MQLPDKGADYYGQQRTEIAGLIDPVLGKSILDVGCGAGGLGYLLRPRGPARLTGIEQHHESVLRARSLYDEVIEGDVASIDPPWPHYSFDYIVYADILEHLVNPGELLSRQRRLLKDDGLIIASVPNIRNRGIIADLFRGNFTYRKSGILDTTHLRFFTFNSVVALFHSSGYEIMELGPSYPAEAPNLIAFWKAQGIERKISELVELLIGAKKEVTDDDLLDLCTLQFLVKARKKTG